MNIKTANRLIDLRKKHGYSQEELASKLGLSRQTISKWERSEASPDTDNLISLANLYGVSLDELIGMNEENYDAEDLSSGVSAEEETTVEDPGSKSASKSYFKSVVIDNNGIKINKKVSDEDGSEVIINGNSAGSSDSEEYYSSVVVDKDGVKVGNKKFFDDDEGEDIRVELGGNYSGEEARAYGIYLKRSSSKKRLILSIVTPLCILAALTAFLLVGFLVPDGAGWRWGWTFFLLIDTIPSFIAAIYARKFCRFNISTVVLFIFLFLGMYMGLWHPTWAVFLVIPVYYMVFGPIDTQIQIHRFQNWISEHRIEASFETKEEDDK